MSCIFGTRQFGNADQGWVAHFILSVLRGDSITVYGNGKQVRDVLWVDDLVEAYVRYLTGNVDYGVWNIVGGPINAVSLLETLDLIQKVTGRKFNLSFGAWREGDQRIYVSDNSRLHTDLGWKPNVSVREGIKEYVDWYKTISQES